MESSGRMLLASAFVTRPVGENLRVETGVSWMRGLGSIFSLQVSTNLDALRAFTSVSSGPTGTEAMNFVQGSVVYSRTDRQMVLASGPALQRSGVSGQVFLDENGNGRRDAGEGALAHVRVRVGNASAVSDSQGHYHVWDLLPFEPVLVVLDSATLPSPLWTPAYSAISVEPAPNQFRRIDLPVVPGGVIEGQVVRETAEGPLGVGGVTIFITERKTGARHSLVTFRDGGFYAMGIKPGEYEMTVSEPVLNRLGMTTEALRFTMLSSREGASVSDLNLVLRP
jgi:hypothetical protein